MTPTFIGRYPGLVPAGNTSSAGSFLNNEGKWTAPMAGVTSIALTVPTGFTITGSPITTSGTLAVHTSLSGVLYGTGSGLAAITVGTSLSWSSPTLSTIQDIRVTASPTFAGLSLGAGTITAATLTYAGNISITATSGGGIQLFTGAGHEVLIDSSGILNTVGILAAGTFQLTTGYNFCLGGTTPANGTNTLVFSQATAPTSVTTNTGQLYMDSADNKLKFRGASGTVTVIANP